jgi:hypothetical protein
MKKSVILFSLVFMSMFFSCKDDSKIEEEVVVQNKPVFKIALDLVIKKDDSLQVFYCENGETEINGANTVWSSVKGNNNSQQVIFNLPEDVFPTKLRIDLSKNKDQDEIEIKGFTINYDEKSFSVKDTMFYQYFIPNEQIDWDRKKAIAKFKSKEGEFFDPQFGSRELMEAELQKLYKK